MSIPDRLFRLAKGKVGELKDYIGHIGENEELSPEEEERLLKSQAHKRAKGELEEAISSPTPPTRLAPSPQLSSQTRRRTPEEIAGSGITYQSSKPVSTSAVVSTSDPLDEHFRLLGLPSGSDFATVQATYEKLEERCKPDRFPSGTPESKELDEIRTRLETSFNALRKALDPTARRFDLIEIE